MASTDMRRVPVIVGVGDYKNPSAAPADALEPLELILRATQRAARDTHLPGAFEVADLLAAADSVQVVRTWTWPYADLPGLLAERLGARPPHKLYSEHGGNSPAKLVDEAARRVAAGQSRVALVAGGEALASLAAYFKERKTSPPWTEPQQEVESVFSPTSRELAPSIGAAHSIGAPIQVYPLYENAFRAHRHQSVQDNHAESARLYGSFAQVAAQNPMSWNYGKNAETDASIATVSKRNRMICYPYPLLMNAFNTVNIAAACILTSAEYAAELGIPESQWIYPLGGAGTKDASDFWERPNFYSSPSISLSLDAGIAAAGLTKDDIDIYDLYSCFPIVPKLACAHLGLSITNPEKPITLLGGLTSFGGAGNNYSMHAITAMVHHLRAHRSHTPTPADCTGPAADSLPSALGTLTRRPPRTGLVLANGGVVSYQHVLVLSSSPRQPSTPPRPGRQHQPSEAAAAAAAAAEAAAAYPARNPLPEQLDRASAPHHYASVPAILPPGPQAAGAAVVETYTLEYARDGSPDKGFVVGRLVGSARGERVLANVVDAAALAELAAACQPFSPPGHSRQDGAELVGRLGWVRYDPSQERCLFTFTTAAAATEEPKASSAAKL